MGTKTQRSRKPSSVGMTAKVRNKLAGGKFAFPKVRKEPLNDARHIRNAIARFDQVLGVSDADRDVAWKRIKRAAKKFDVEVSEGSWHELGKPARKSSGKSRPQTKAPGKKTNGSTSPKKEKKRKKGRAKP